MSPNTRPFNWIIRVDIQHKLIPTTTRTRVLKMVLSMDVSSALQQLESLKKTIDDSDDAKLQMNTTDDLNLIINLLQVCLLFSFFPTGTIEEWLLSLL